MSLCIGFENASSNVTLPIKAVLGYGSGLHLINTLLFPVALVTRNSMTLSNPSSCKDSTAWKYPVSVIDRKLLLPCLKALNVTDGPDTERMFSFTVFEVRLVHGFIANGIRYLLYELKKK